MTKDDLINSEIEAEHKELQNTVREINIRTLSPCKIFARDNIGSGGANHKYTIEYENGDLGNQVAYINFQNGTEPENGVNGCTMEDLIAICIDRLEHFQMGNFPCRENMLAKTKLEEALMWLNKRTQDRLNRGVEGKEEK